MGPKAAVRYCYDPLSETIKKSNLKQTAVWVMFLHSRKDRRHTHNHAQDKINSDNGDVQSVPTASCIEHVQQDVPRHDRCEVRAEEERDPAHPGPIAALRVIQPGLVPSVREVDQQQQLDQDEDEGEDVRDNHPGVRKIIRHPRDTPDDSRYNQQILPEPEAVLDRPADILAGAHLYHNKGEEEEEKRDREHDLVDEEVGAERFTRDHTRDVAGVVTVFADSWRVVGSVK